MFKTIATLRTKEPNESHPMVVINKRLFVVDGNEVVEIIIPPETLYLKIKKLLKRII